MVNYFSFVWYQIFYSIFHGKNKFKTRFVENFGRRFNNKISTISVKTKFDIKYRWDTQYNGLSINFKYNVHQC